MIIENNKYFQTTNTLTVPISFAIQTCYWFLSSLSNVPFYKIVIMNRCDQYKILYYNTRNGVSAQYQLFYY